MVIENYSKKRPKFLRRRWYSYGKLGKRRKQKQKWRNPTGRDNKLREKRRGYQAVVSIGYRTESSERGKINNKTLIRIENMNDLKKINREKQIAVLGKLGNKSKMEIATYAKEHKIEIQNLNVNKFLKKAEKLKKSDKTEKKTEEKTTQKTEAKSEEKKQEEKKENIKQGAKK